MALPPRLPALYPDIIVREEDLPLSWPARILVNGQPADFRNYGIICPLINNGELLGLLPYVEDTDTPGTLVLTLTAEYFALMARYSTWEIRDTDAFHGPLIRGRLVKQEVS